MRQDFFAKSPFCKVLTFESFIFFKVSSKTSSPYIRKKNLLNIVGWHNYLYLVWGWFNCCSLYFWIARVYPYLTHSCKSKQKPLFFSYSAKFWIETSFFPSFCSNVIKRNTFMSKILCKILPFHSVVLLESPLSLIILNCGLLSPFYGLCYRFLGFPFSNSETYLLNIEYHGDESFSVLSISLIFET